MKKNNSIYAVVFVFISCVLFLFFAVGIIQNPSGPQKQIFFVGMDDFFADFFNVLRYIAERDPYFNPINGYSEKVGFPLGYLILYPFSQLDNFNTMSLQETWNSKIGLMSLFLLTGFSVFLLLMAQSQIIKKYSISHTVLISLFLSYVLFFSIERGNIIILSAAFIGFFICYYDSGNKYKRMLAVICLAFVATMKVYPVLFGFLYFEKKQYREIFLGATITLVLIFIPFLFFKRGFANIPQLVNNVRQITDTYSITRSYPRFSLAHLVFRASTLLKFPDKVILQLSNIAQIVIILASFVSIVFSCLIKNKWIKVSLLTMTVVFLPIHSALYCGLYIFPMIILFFATLEERSKLFNVFILIVFVVFLNPYQIVIKSITINYLFANIVLLALWLVLLVYSGKQIVAILKNKRIIQA